MIILRLAEEQNTQKKRSLKRKKRNVKEELFNYSRSGIIIDNKPHFVISVTEKTLEDFEFQQLLDKYKGSIIVPENLETQPEISKLVFDATPFMKKAVFENFRIMICNGDYKDATLLIKDMDFLLSDEIPRLLPYVKSITVYTSSLKSVKEWQENCFVEYGVKPKVVSDEKASFMKFDIFADFENIENDYLKISIYNEIKKIYPNFKFLQIPDELKILENFNISKKMICAAFKR